MAIGFTAGLAATALLRYLQKQGLVQAFTEGSH
jgi:hypothetical protein